jgi:hypothetical protein
MNIKIAPIGIIAALVFALAPAQPCFAIGGLTGTPVSAMGGNPMGGNPNYTRASPYSGDVPGEPQGREDNPWARRAAMEKTELHFDLSQCQQIEAGLYKCAVADKPICNPDYKGQAECVRIGPTGSVYVLSRFAY